MKQTVALSFLFFFLLSCTNRDNGELYNYQPRQVIDLTDKSNSFDITDRIKNIDVLNLTVGDSWVHLRYPRMAISEEGYYFLSDRTDFLIGYSKTGELKFSKQIKGRGRGE